MQNQFLTPEPTPNFDLHLNTPETGTGADTAQTETAHEAEMAQEQAVAALLTAAKRKIRRRRNKFWGAFTLLESANLLIFIPSLLGYHFISSMVFLVTFLVTLLTAFAIMLRTVLAPVDFDTEELARLGGARAVPALLDSLNSGMTPGVRKTIYRALAGLLPQMHATDANLLTARHRRVLNYLLNAETWPGLVRKPEGDFMLAVLKAYEQVGDAKAIPIVAKLANSKARNERQRAIQQAAQQCLPLLQANTAPLDSSQTLLRAADQFQAAPDVLLRPAVGTTTGPAGELLRVPADALSPLNKE